MAIQIRNSAAASLFAADLEQNTGELHLTAVNVAVTPYAAGANSVLLCVTGAVNLVVNLPQVSANRGKVYAIKKRDVGAGQVVVTPFAGDTIDGAGSRNVVNQWDSIIIIAGPSTVWYVISAT